MSSSRSGRDPWADEPSWHHDVTSEWQARPGQRYPGEPAPPDPEPQQTTAELPRVIESPAPTAAVSPAAPVVGYIPGPGPRRVEPAWNRPATALPDRLRGPQPPTRQHHDEPRPAGRAPRLEPPAPPAHTGPPAPPVDTEPPVPPAQTGPPAPPVDTGPSWFQSAATVRATPPPESTGTDRHPPERTGGATATTMGGASTGELTGALAPNAHDTGPPTLRNTVTAGTALREPTAPRPMVPGPTTRPDGGRPFGPAAVDPEQLLAAYPWRLDPRTLRELADDPTALRRVRDALTDKLHGADVDSTRARLLSLRAVVSRVLGDLDPALADGRAALRYAQATGELRRTAIVQARLAHVLQWRGDFGEADRLYAQANSVELPDRLRATMHEHAGRCCYEQGRHIEACLHFERALDLRRAPDPALITRTEVALDAVLARVRESGWGPYPRTREEILQVPRPPVPTFSAPHRRWGYADGRGAFTVPPQYADAQPFHEGSAWVRRTGVRAWELIDESGAVLIDASAGYLGAASFSDGLAWVSHDGGAGWFAIDARNRLVVSGGFTDVRPFRSGLAVVRHGGWGAIDRRGRFVVPPRFSAFATALTDGRYVDGFTDEGLAVVDAGGYKGVVDRRGQLIVPPVHHALAIHPVAFLIGDHQGRWGALDRRGEPLIDVLHARRGGVAEEIDRLLADTRPVL